MNQPAFEIDPKAFWSDPYPALKKMRCEQPVCFVPQLNAVLLTRRDAIAECEKNIEVFSSEQPDGLMTVLMGHNMMRKDGEAHQNERKQMFPTVSPRTVRDHWKELFAADTLAVLDQLKGRDRIDLVRDYAMPVSAHALRRLTGLTNLSTEEMDRVSQHMIEGVANYGGDPEIEARCHTATARIDAAIDERLPQVADTSDQSLISVLTRAGQHMDSVRANIKLAISGGQNEPRDAIAGAVWALLSHPEQLERTQKGSASWLQAFEEYARWISPIGMSPREIRQAHTVGDFTFKPGQRVFLMFSSANRDETIFDQPDTFDITRDNAKAISFGAGPHFCAGAAASRVLIADVALPMLFERFPDLALDGDTPFGGWAFRGPLKMPVKLG